MKSAVPVLPVASAQSGPPFVDRFGGRYCHIARSDELPPFLMNVVSSSELWLFVASNGGLTAGRISSEQALFPYLTVDRIYDCAGVTGPVTAIRVERDGQEVLWEPFAAHTSRLHAIERHLYKSVEGDRVWFEEINAELGLAFRYGWSTAEAHGFVRRCELENLSDAPVSAHVLDGLRNLLPPDIAAILQRESSCLVDAYKTAELLPSSSLAVYALQAGITDRTVPVEALRATAVWSEGLPEAAILLSDAQIDAFYRSEDVETETHRRGVRCTYALAAGLTLAPHSSRSWLMVADTNLTQAAVAERRRALAAGGLVETVLAAVDESTRRLREFVALADGLQTGGAEPATVHHFANTLFNVLRGGIFVSGYELPTADFAAFVAVRHRAAARRHGEFLAALPAALDRRDLLARLATRGDADLDRLGLEYLPLTFSRRHGDPSRPWNRFAIRVRDHAGARVLNYEGNWRDIFQNWEALCLSFPEYFESIVAKFVNASTLDGYNPYRISRDGIEWEVPEAENPWASIGYWGDHQTVYLLKLLEWSARFHPGALAPWLRRALFSYADVPYRIASFAATRRNPHSTIEFDVTRHREIERRAAAAGSDAKLVHDTHGGVLHVNLTEKLLVLLLTKLSNLVPGGGLWLNTQRPEWNDANNALVGYGLSVVTLSYLRRMLAHVRDVLLPALGSEPVAVSAAVVQFVQRIGAALESHRALLASPVIDDASRLAALEALGTAGSDYRDTIYREGAGAPVALAPAEIGRLVTLALAFVDHSIRANRREDGLYHSYNLLEFTDSPPALKLHYLAPMLEGQVAVLSAGLLSSAEAAALLRALRRSPLYREDQHTYLLYPDRQLPGFLDRNVIPEEWVVSTALLRDMLAAGDTRLVLRDGDGRVRFHHELVSREALQARLQRLSTDPRWGAAVQVATARVAEVYEAVFNHRAFTGRSGTMFGYEGLGSTYWHMVAKLLLAAQENLVAAGHSGDPAAPALAERYYDIRGGLGFNKTARAYGAFPTDPYSHTPGHSGAQQPGMTGQVKEEVLTRFGELGVIVEAGAVRFAPRFLQMGEFTTGEQPFRYLDPAGVERELALPPGALGFTFCGTPVVYRLSIGAARLTVHLSDGSTAVVAGDRLEPALSAELFRRTGRIVRLAVELGGSFQPFVS